MTCALLLHAEAEPMPEPTGPCFKNAPAVSEWKITFSKRTQVPQGSCFQDEDSTATELKAIDVSKAKTTRHEVILTNAGQTTDRWYYSGMVLYVTAGNPAVFVFDMRDEHMAHMFPNYSATDFPELSWINRSCYAGIQKIGNTACDYYAAPGGTKQAWIDQATGLPMVYTCGNTVQSYTFHELGARQLELPAPFQKALNDFSATRSLSRHEAHYN